MGGCCEKRVSNKLSVISKHHLKLIIYRIFSIKRPRRLFQTWPHGPGGYSKPAFNRGPAFINEVFFLLPFYQVDLLTLNLRYPDGTIFPSIQSDKLSSWVFSQLHTIAYSIRTIVCVKKKEHKQYMLNIEAR